jgi:hypothetical protein
MIWTLLYVVGGVLSWVWLSRGVLKEFAPDNPEMFDYVFAVVFGAAAAIFWPLAWIVWGLASALKRGDEEEKVTEVPPHDPSLW